MQRILGRSGIEVSAVGMGCWAIGGPAWRGDTPVGWGQVDDQQSILAVHEALDLGVNLFDTANAYGAGHSERVLGRALSGRRDDAVIATKFNAVFDESTKQFTGTDLSPDGVRSACDASLARLGTDFIDLYQLHDGAMSLEQVPDMLNTLEGLAEAGKIRSYGWSTDDPDRIAAFAEGKHCGAVQQHFNIFGGNAETLKVAEEAGLAALIRGPLAMGLLSGKFSPDSTMPSDDVRAGWNFTEGPIAEQLAKLELVRSILTEDERTLVQGGLGWLWARSPVTLPIPGFKTVEQVRENAGALAHGPLTDDQMRRVDAALA